MTYVFDSNSLSTILKFYYPDRFVTFWNLFAEAIRDGNVVSVAECKLEIEEMFEPDEVNKLLAHNENFFLSPTREELDFVSDIYSIPHFHQNLNSKKLLQGGPFADPFVIAQAKAQNGVVITEEKWKDNAAKIPNICRHFEIDCTNLEGFMERENWSF